MGNLSRNRSMTKPERFRPRQGMLNRTPSTKHRDEQRQQQQQQQQNQPSSASSSSHTPDHPHPHDSRFDSTGNLLEESTRSLTGVLASAENEGGGGGGGRPFGLTSSSPLRSNTGPLTPQEQQRQERLRQQQAQQRRNQQQEEQQRIALERGRTIAGRGGGGGAGGRGAGPGGGGPGGPGHGRQRANTITRANTMIQRANSKAQQGKAAIRKKMAEREIELTPWVIFSRIMTFCLPSSLLRCCSSKLTNAHVVQAWREKVTLCILILFICGLLAYLIFGVKPTMCPDNARAVINYSTNPTDGKPAEKNNHIESVIVRGTLYPFEDMRRFLQTKNITLAPDYRANDISALFFDDTNPCSSFFVANTTSCSVPNPYKNPPLVARPCLAISQLQRLSSQGRLSFLWTDLDDKRRRDFDNLVVFDGNVFNVTKYLNSVAPFGSEMQNVLSRSLRKDASMLIMRTESRKKYIDCLASQTEVGVLENTTMGCFAAQTIMITTLICVCMVVGIKFLMALTFNWFLSYRLTEKERSFKSSKGAGGANKAAGGVAGKPKGSGGNEAGDKDVVVRQKKNAGRKNLYTAMLVTCYSEGESSIRTTLNSLANTSYSVKHKLIVVICDGIVRGHGNKLTTPEIVINMIDLAPGSENPKASSYLAIADGEKQHNMAKVYGGHYVYKQRRVPIVVVVKSGNPLEKESSRPGNRGKRDSQLILMSFFQRVLFADRFTELDFEMFRQIRDLMGVYPDQFELVLMVDADTMVKGDSLSYMVTAMQNDHTIMGLCGETMIANKTASWVTMIQVFEYYISHHLGKAFESVFGGVTCLPGCFCMYRIKAPKGNSWVPILANPEVIQEYNQNIVMTLHEKNLLLLGEDRYLTTLMLRTFPKRQMVFVPQAQCKTVVPDTFKVLLSQRRRWINSTIHNLLELVLVTDLCGIAFLSMQFVVLLELIGTVVLPAAILFSVGMITYAIINQTIELLPLIFILTIIGLPAVLIVLTTRQWVYVLWMLMYLVSLPIWHFVLPLYSFWHFDDFSWGETRKVANMKRKGQDHGEAEGEFESGSVVMRKWEEWEKDRLKKLGYRIMKRQSADHGINDLPPPAASMDDRKVRKSQSTVNLSRGNGPQRPSVASAPIAPPGMGAEPGPGGPMRQSTIRRSPTGPSGGPPRPFSHMAQSTPNLLGHDPHQRPPSNMIPPMPQSTISFASPPRMGSPAAGQQHSPGGPRPLGHFMSISQQHSPGGPRPMGPPTTMGHRPSSSMSRLPGETIEMGPMLPGGGNGAPGLVPRRSIHAPPMQGGFRPPMNVRPNAPPMPRPGMPPQGGGPPPPGFRPPPPGHPGQHGPGPMGGGGGPPLPPMMVGGPGRPPLRPMYSGPPPAGPPHPNAPLGAGGPPPGMFVPLGGGGDIRMSQYSMQSAGVSSQGENNSTSGLLTHATPEGSNSDPQYLPPPPRQTPQGQPSLASSTTSPSTPTTLEPRHSPVEQANAPPS
ncbi:Chitin synthase, class 3 [Actinomortierella ambigua]|nr:Chitin synthase, class 3 [Actinomortierella ambigua]